MKPKIELDNLAELATIDVSDMLGVLEEFPGQLEEAIRIGRSDVGLPSLDGPRAVAVLGMGGSGISGDVVAALAGADGYTQPVTTVKGYRLPPFIDAESLVFAVSYSGNTEETLEALEEALKRGAAVIAVSSGGSLAEIAEERSIPLFEIPGGMQPRASLGYLFVPILCALERMGMLRGVAERLEAAARLMELRRTEYGISSRSEDNPAKRLARDLVGYAPIVYGAEGYLSVAASRWKAQFNEMAKVPSFNNYFPELNHNETVGWQNLGEVCGKCHVIALGEPGIYDRIDKRVRITLDLIQESVGRTTRVCARGSNTVERLLDLMYLGDYTSVFLALLLGQDPTPVTRIENLKRQLSE